jgi:hypothetical protein
MFSASLLPDSESAISPLLLSTTPFSISLLMSSSAVGGLTPMALARSVSLGGRPDDSRS